jgi:hypothetical protein
MSRIGRDDEGLLSKAKQVVLAQEPQNPLVIDDAPRLRSLAALAA